LPDKAHPLLKRLSVTNDMCVNPLPDAETVLGSTGEWIEDYDEKHPGCGRKRRSSREFVKAIPFMPPPA
jgi:hypothetical protein